MKTILLILVITYLFISIFLFLFQRKLMYFPTPQVTLSDEKEIFYEVNGVKLYGWVINEGREKALIYYGGNAESIEDNMEYFKKLLPQYSIYLINYRGYGKSEGKPFEKGLLLDAAAIYDEIAKKHNSISLMGRSLGTGIAIFVASQKKIDKLVLISPYDSAENIAKSIYKILPVSVLLKDKYDSTKHISKIKAETLILYASQDEIVPPIHTKNLITYFKDKTLHVVNIEKATHNDISFFNKYKQTIERFLK